MADNSSKDRNCSHLTDIISRLDMLL